MPMIRRFFLPPAAVPTALLLLTLPAVLALGPFQSRQSGSIANTDAPTTAGSPGCSEPELKHRTFSEGKVVQSCSLKSVPNLLDIGMAPDKPFTAKESVTMWRALPSDEKQRREMKKKLPGWKTSQENNADNFASSTIHSPGQRGACLAVELGRTECVGQCLLPAGNTLRPAGGKNDFLWRNRRTTASHRTGQPRPRLHVRRTQ